MVGDLIVRKRPYLLGLLGYATGALAMTPAQSTTVAIIFWVSPERRHGRPPSSLTCGRLRPSPPGWSAGSLLPPW